MFLLSFDAYSSDAYLGDRRSSYNRFLVVKLSFDSIANVQFGFGDVRLASGLQEISIPLLYQQNPDPVPNKVMTYRFRLNENANYEWSPKGLSVQQWVGLLNQVTSIKIKATYTDTCEYHMLCPATHRDTGVELSAARVCTRVHCQMSADAHTRLLGNRPRRRHPA